MENFELRKAVAEALGCKLEKMPQYDDVFFCQQHDPHVIKPYDLDHHAALDALMEFCYKNGYHWEIDLMRNRRYSCAIWKLDPLLRSELVAYGFDSSLAICICEVIVKAAEGKG